MPCRSIGMASGSAEDIYLGGQGRGSLFIVCVYSVAALVLCWACDLPHRTCRAVIHLHWWTLRCVCGVEVDLSMVTCGVEVENPWEGLRCGWGMYGAQVGTPRVRLGLTGSVNNHILGLMGLPSDEVVNPLRLFPRSERLSRIFSFALPHDVQCKHSTVFALGPGHNPSNST